MKKILSILKERPLIFDGAMGTSIQNCNLTTDDYQGKDGCHDYLSLVKPDLIKELHESFLKAGADVVETNTFQGSRLKLAEFGLEKKTFAVNKAAAAIARKVCDAYSTPDKPRFVAGSIGPTGMLPSSTDPELGKLTSEDLETIFEEQAIGLIEGGCDILLVETSQDILEARAAVFGCLAAMQSTRKELLLMVQVTLDTNGKMLLGTDIESVLITLQDLQVHVIGLNCSTGPSAMRETIRYLSKHSLKPISCIPNAGIPENVDGEVHYPLTPEELARYHREFVEDYGVEIVGGCCGTTPDHIAAVVKALDGVKPAPREVTKITGASNLIGSINFDIDNKPLLIGERINSQGSRKAKRLLLADDYEALVELGRHQVGYGAHLLDVCAAMNERTDEADQVRKLVKLLSFSLGTPIMIDSTEADVVEKALAAIPGRAVINSINLEKGGERITKILPLAQKYRAALVAMTIDEEGMAKTAERKAAIAERTCRIATEEYQLSPKDLIFDCLTFTLATGDKEYADSAVQTIEGIRLVKERVPEVYTILGVSNVSFGLSKPVRKVINSVFLYHAVQAGLDMAIVNPKDIIPYPDIPDRERELVESLIFNRNPDSLGELIRYFEGKSPDEKETTEVESKSIEAQIYYAILHQQPKDIEKRIDQILSRYKPADIINDILLPAMKEVGDKMATGELILPFVLQSAEVMKKAIAHLEQYMDKRDTVSKGKVVLATVYGDVHDIGKNLVKTILTNNGFTVYDLGKQVPLNTILSKAKEVQADVIGLSALLVTTSKQMGYCIEELHKDGLRFPVICGGAAINRDFVNRISMVEEDKVYPHGAFYAKDAFQGLKIVNQLINDKEKALLLDKYQQEAMALPEREARREALKAQKTTQVTEATRVQVSEAPIPVPPFWGVKMIEDIPVEDIFPYLNKKALFKLQWGVRQKDKESTRALIEDEFEPLLDALQQECIDNAYLKPVTLYGFFPCYKAGDDLVILSPDDLSTEIQRFSFPRQKTRQGLCLTDYFRSRVTGPDVIGMHVSTIGAKATQLIDQLNAKGEYAKSLYLHGLSVETAEALAEWLHLNIRKELDIAENRGKRYSFGYPACPDLSDQVKLFSLLQPERRIGVTLTESFQMVPEQTTSAIVIHHPEAKYFVVD